MRASTLLALLALAVTAAGAVYLRGQSGVTVVVSTRDLPAFHRISQEDVVETRVAKSSLPAAFESDEDAVIGKFTTSPLDKSSVLVGETLGPRLNQTNPSALVVTALDASPAQALSGALKAGDRVTLLISDAPSAIPLVIRHVIVLHEVRVKKGAYVVTVGLQRKQAKAFASTTLTDWRLLRERAYEQH
jgi:hypothetical protein